MIFLLRESGIACVPSMHGIVGIKYEATPDKGKAGEFDPTERFFKCQYSKKEMKSWRNVLPFQN
jgi:hypothetical protein